MSRKSEFKENSGSKSSTDSVKRQKMNENVNFSKTGSEFEDSSLSVTVYEDDNDLTYYNRPSIGRLGLNNSLGKRSPLATINKAADVAGPSSSSCIAGPSSSSCIAGPSTSSYIAGPSTSSCIAGPSTSSCIAGPSTSSYFAGPSTSSYIAGPSTSSYNQPTKSPSMLDLAFLKRHEPKEILNDPFQYLSDEILLQIFSYLPKKTLNRIAQVCSRFHRVMQDETLWIWMDLANKFIRRGAISEILCRGLIILRMAQTKIQSPIFDPYFEAEGFQSKLQYLDLSMAAIDKTSLAQLLGVCRSLKKLSIEALEIDNRTCREISQNVDLEVLNMAMCEGISTKGVTMMMESLQNLVSLNISWTQLDTYSVTAVMGELTPKITRLNIAGCRKSLMDKHLKTLSERCPNIVELDISDCSMLGSDTIQYVKVFKKLEYLSLSRCYNIPMHYYLTLFKVESLRYLDVFGLLNDNGIRHITKVFTEIEINKFIHSSVARPTVTPRRTSIWGLKTRD